MLTVNGPPIRQRITDLDNGWRLRSSYGDTPGAIRRYDIHDGTGWRDFSVEDKDSGTFMYLWDKNGNVTMARLGRSEWAGKGPAVPAERGCTECHKDIKMALESDPQFQSELLLTLIGLNGPYKKDKPASAPAPKPLPVVQGPTGPQGPVGPKGAHGEPGPPGNPGKDADPQVIIRAVKEWLDAHKDELRGKDGTNGLPGVEGKPGPRPSDDELIVLIKQVISQTIPPVADKDTHVVIVADQKASYWPRLSNEIDIARGYYSSIRVAPPPEFSVVLPQIVVYVGGLPGYRSQGISQVSNDLQRMVRGEFEPVRKPALSRTPL